MQHQILKKYFGFITMKNHQSTLIIGGGIVGATLALKLAKACHPVTLIDARPKLSQADWEQKLAQRDARVYALSLASINLLKDVEHGNASNMADAKLTMPKCTFGKKMAKVS